MHTADLTKMLIGFEPTFITESRVEDEHSGDEPRSRTESDAAAAVLQVKLKAPLGTTLGKSVNASVVVEAPILGSDAHGKAAQGKAQGRGHGTSGGVEVALERASSLHNRRGPDDGLFEDGLPSYYCPDMKVSLVEKKGKEQTGDEHVHTVLNH